MKESQEKKGNPEIGMQANSIEEAAQQQTNDTGSSNFFNRLENEVNGVIQDNTEATQSQISGPEQVTHTNQDYGSNNVQEQSGDGTDWQKRYTDSSREAVKWRDRFKSVEPFVPVLEAMKNDSGLVDHVRDYLVGGGKPAKTVQEQLNLGEDFEFDQQEAMANPESDSAKVMNAHVDELVQARVGQMLKAEKQRSMQNLKAKSIKQQKLDFMKKNNMSPEQFKAFEEKAKQRQITLDDIGYLMNRDANNQNVANSTKADMLSQMKNVRDIPTSASGANSQAKSKDPDSDIFDGILGLDGGVDNLFG